MDTTTSYDQLLRLFLNLRTRKEIDTLLHDLLTDQEIEKIVQRLQIVKLIAKGVPQRKISERLGVSIAKVTRGSLAVKESNGLFKRMLS